MGTARWQRVKGGGGKGTHPFNRFSSRAFPTGGRGGGRKRKEGGKGGGSPDF